MKLGLGLSLANRGGAGGLSSPIPSAGLSLWLKADAGLTTTPSISQVVISGGGRSAMNGTYTRASGGDTSFVKTGDSNFQIHWSGAEWYINGDEYYCESEENNQTEYAYNPSYDMSSNWLISVEYGCDGTPPTSITTTTLLVTGWADQSGNGKNATPSSLQQTLSTFGGKSFISFPVDSSLSNYDGIWTDPDLIIGTIIMVARFPSSGFATYLFRVDPTMYFGRSDDSKILLSVDDIENVQSSGTMSNNINYLIGATFDTNNLFLYLNGVNDGSGAGQTQVGSPPYLVGGHANPSSIAEVVVYNRVLSTPERQQVEAYLNAKYAIY